MNAHTASRQHAGTLIPFPALVLAVLLIALQASVGLATPPAMSSLSFLPGDDVVAAASGHQYLPAIAEGDNQYLVVWVDARTSFVDPGVAVGNVTISRYVGSSMDVYAARLDASGNLLDPTPIIVAQDLQNQGLIDVAWNGTNYLVVYTGQSGLECCPVEDRYAVRVSPAGAVLDETPITLATGTTANALWPGTLAGDDTNWVFMWITNSQMRAQRIANDGTVLDPGGVVVVPSIWLGSDFDLVYAGGEYLLVWVPLRTEGQRFTPDLTPIASPFQINAPARNLQVATDGTDYFVVWWDDRFPIQARIMGARVTHNGTVLDPNGVLLLAPVYNPYQPQPDVAWDGTNWMVVYDKRDPRDLVGARVTPAGVVLDYDTNAFPVSTAPETQNSAAIACLPGAPGALAVWVDDRHTPAGGTADPGDIFGVIIDPDGGVGTEFPVSVGTPRQTLLSMIPNDSGFLAVYRSETSPETRILAQRLDAAGTAIDLEPVKVATGSSDLTNPAVAWNGSLYLVVWEDQRANQTFGRRMSADLTPLDLEPFEIMPGNTPDVAAIGDIFAVATSWENPHEVRGGFTVRVRGSDGAILDPSPRYFSAGYTVYPSIAAVGGRWLAAWQSHPTHDDPNSSARANFIDSNGFAGAAFIVDNDATKPVVAGRADQAAVVFSGRTGAGLHYDIFARRYLADGSSLDPTRAITITNVERPQFDPAAAWDGSEWVTTFADFRNNVQNMAVQSDLYAARFDDDGTVLDPDGFPFADDALPELFPAVTGAGGMFLVGGSIFRPEAGYASYRIGLSSTAATTGIDAGTAGEPALPLLRVSNNVTDGTLGISLHLDREQNLSVNVYDTSGRKVRRLFAGRAAVGPQQLTWDGRDERGERVAAGVYFVSARAEASRAAARVIRF